MNLRILMKRKRGTYSELAIFLTIAAGFWIGKMKIKQFSLGIVTSVLLVGVNQKS